jgi:hypothetical protein
MKKYDLEYFRIFVLVNSLETILQGLFNPLLNILDNVIRGKGVGIIVIGFGFLNPNFLIQMRLNASNDLTVFPNNTLYALKAFPDSLIEVFIFIRVWVD